MLELIISSLIAIFIFIAGQLLKLDDAMLELLFNSIPVLIPTYVMWKNTPKNYLRFITLKGKGITFLYTAKISSCQITKDEFAEVNEHLRDFNDAYKGNDKRILNYDISEFCYSSILEVDSTFIKIYYNVATGVLLIESKAKMDYRVFVDRIQRINEALIKATTKFCFTDILVSLKLNFINEDDEESRNPFIKKIFNGFNKKIISISYEAANNSEVKISNHTIEFLSNSITSINNDIKSELTLLGLFRK